MTVTSDVAKTRQTRSITKGKIFCFVLFFFVGFFPPRAFDVEGNYLGLLNVGGGVLSLFFLWLFFFFFFSPDKLCCIYIYNDVKGEHFDIELFF